MNSRRQRVIWRMARRRNWRKQADAFVALGLTTRGTRRIYRLHAELDHLHGRPRAAARNRGYRAAQRRKGFTTRGNRIKNFSLLAIAYEEFRATIKMPAINFAVGRWE